MIGLGLPYGVGPATRPELKEWITLWGRLAITWDHHCTKRSVTALRTMMVALQTSTYVTTSAFLQFRHFPGNYPFVPN